MFAISVSLPMCILEMNDNYGFGKWSGERGVMKPGGGEAHVLAPSVGCWQGSRCQGVAQLGRWPIQASGQEREGQGIGWVKSAFRKFRTSCVWRILPLTELSRGTEGNLLGHLIKLVWL